MFLGQDLRFQKILAIPLVSISLSPTCGSRCKFLAAPDVTPCSTITHSKPLKS